MADEGTCYQCQHNLVCSLKHSIDKAIHEHLHFVDVDAPRDENHWVEIYRHLPKFCLRYAPLEPEADHG